MKISTLQRHVRESGKSLYRNGWMTFASISAVTITLLLVGSFVSVILNINHMAESVADDVQINVQIDVTATEEETNVLKQQIEAIDNVESVIFISKDEELTRLKESFGEDSQAFDLFEQDNPLSNIYEVTTTTPDDVSEVAKQIEPMDSVMEVQYGEAETKKLLKIVDWIRWGGTVLILGLVFTAMFLISNTIKITIFARKNEIGIMRLVGATNGFIRIPFLLEGLFLGVLGSIIPIFLTLVTYQSVYTILMAQMSGSMFDILPVNPYGIYISLLLLAIGGLIGMWGSVMSIRRFLNK